MTPPKNPRAELVTAGVVLLVLGAVFGAALLLAFVESTDEAATPTARVQATPATQPVILVPTLTASATQTPRPTQTEIPTEQPSATATATPTATATVTGSPTATNTAAYTPTVAQTATPSPSLTSSQTASPSCGPPAGWVQGYTVQPGDTVYRISRRYGIALEALLEANCMTEYRIYGGQRLWVPHVIPTSDASPTSPASAPLTPAGNPTTAVALDPCSNPLARITSPRHGAEVDGPFWVEGTANIPNFMRYKIEVRRDGTQTYMHLETFTKPVVEARLAKVDPALFGSGAYWVYLTVVDQTYNYPPSCGVLVYFP